MHETLLKWSEKHGLTVNKAKCKTLCICYRKSDHVTPVHLPDVSFVKSLKILGVTFNEKLDWNDHCTYIVKNALKRLYVLRVLKNFVSREELICVYNTIVRACLEYASPLFVKLSSSNCKKLERVQSRFHRLLCGQECRNLCLQSLETRRQAAAVKLFRQTLEQSHVLHHLVPTKSLTGRFLLPTILSTRRLKTFFISMALYLNSSHSR